MLEGPTLPTLMLSIRYYKKIAKLRTYLKHKNGKQLFRKLSKKKKKMQGSRCSTALFLGKPQFSKLCAIAYFSKQSIIEMVRSSDNRC